ncbi:glycosyl hydrolase family 28-related protein [Aestuariibius sp. 2305UL40-4]|uniref:glycosyl hydrolase family 28-related protein n=1 Tax=Aestuariibius violaceus TaxID=3234132 RepID=UPI00345F0EEA
MNMAITDGLALTPPPFADGLEVWSSGNGTPGSDTYAGSGPGAFLPADQDFGGCLEIFKADEPTRLRYMGQTPILPGCYLKVTARVKAVSGVLPTVRIAGYAARSDGSEVTTVTRLGPAVQLTSYGTVVEVSAIIGTGNRGGVHMVWSGDVAYGHLGIDIQGANGAVIRVDDLEIEDISGAFLSQLVSTVDVRDYGAVGDGVTDDHAAFVAADNAADGREVLVPEGTFFIGSNLSMSSFVRFRGRLTMAATTRFILTNNYDYPTYVDAFKDEEVAFAKAFQALLHFTDHESLDLGGRRIGLTRPLDMQAAVATRDTFAVRRVIRNGQFHALESPDWEAGEVTSQASYSTSNATTLSNVQNIANIEVGSLVEGSGVGREVYVQAVNVGQRSLTLSQPLFDAEGTQVYTFRRFRYLLDFSGFNQLNVFGLEGIEFQCEGRASGIMLARTGVGSSISGCFITKPKDRGITSIQSACQGLLIDQCQFLSNEQPLRVQDRTTLVLNVNANDVKIRDCRAVRFRHFAVLAGTGHTITGNHWFNGDDETDGVRVGGIVFTTPNVKSLITANYIDNNFIEWTNEHEANPNFNNQFSFGGMTITGNTFTVNDAASWFNWLVIKPYGEGHFIQGLAVIGNVFRTLNGNIDRIERVDTTYADLNYFRMVNVVFSANTFNGINEPVYNPVSLRHEEASAASVWTVNGAPYLPFGGNARVCESVVPRGALKNSGGTTVYPGHHVDINAGSNNDQLRINWELPVKGAVNVVLRMDNPS